MNFARLAPVRTGFGSEPSIPEGLTSAAPAVLEFRILPPFWLRWWFLLLVAILGGITVYMVYRYRVRRLLELERVRSRIARTCMTTSGPAFHAWRFYVKL